MASNEREQWLEWVGQAVGEGTLVKLSLAAPRGGDPALRRLRVRPVLLRTGARLQFVWEMATQDITKNLELVEALVRLREVLGNPFGTALATTTSHTAQLEIGSKGEPSLKLLEVATPRLDVNHDRTKARRVDTRRPWLKALGVTTAEGAVCKGMEPKFRQIHRFVELLEPLLVAARLVGDSSAGQTKPLRLVDMGCGKGYLTFAAHEFLQEQSDREVRTWGVEARSELAERGNRLALETGSVGLEFLAGTIEETPFKEVDILVALHACDTATDDALAAGIQAGATLMIVAPCCHKEVRPQLIPPPMLEGTLRHGIFRERQAEFVTDALRAALLEAVGYETRVFEFVSPEHTAKNLMIAALKRREVPDREVSLKTVRRLAAFYGVARQRLAERLGITLS